MDPDHVYPVSEDGGPSESGNLRTGDWLRGSPRLLSARDSNRSSLTWVLYFFAALGVLSETATASRPPWWAFCVSCSPSPLDKHEEEESRGWESENRGDGRRER
ncbi:hypothetical protein OH76DRAFT_1410130 [Lentinus brumalis]|uniref:Uncharacterized protein n=1 Tax=Lentinus brumalis TaxID=2498619 RepID=A0A371CT84_9APHY|nr:hypothetical protein OH76DRAFT_1410130 [Polyporus brumalis]